MRREVEKNGEEQSRMYEGKKGCKRRYEVK